MTYVKWKQEIAHVKLDILDILVPTNAQRLAKPAIRIQIALCVNLVTMEKHAPFYALLVVLIELAKKVTGLASNARNIL